MKNPACILTTLLLREAVHSRMNDYLTIHAKEIASILYFVQYTRPFINFVRKFHVNFERIFDDNFFRTVAVHDKAPIRK